MDPTSQQNPDPNAKFLADSLVWLRLRLRRLAEANIDKVGTARDESNDFIWQPEDGETEGKITDAQIASADEARQKFDQSSPAPALFRLAQQLCLSKFEREMLLLCAAMELDPRIGHLCAAIHGDPAMSYPTFSLAMSVFDDPAWDILSPERPLRFWRLLEINQSPLTTLMMSPLRADERIVNFIKGLNYVDDRVSPLLSKIGYRHEEILLSQSQRELAKPIAQYLHDQANGMTQYFHLVGAARTSKELVARWVASEFNIELYKLSVNRLARFESELETLARLMLRDSLLMPISYFVDAHDLGAKQADSDSVLVRRLMGMLPGVVFLSTRDSLSELAVNRVVVDVSKPTASEQEAVWEDHLAGKTDLPSILSGQFSMDLPDIAQLAEPFRLNECQESVYPSGKHPFEEEVWDVCRAQTRPQLDSLAQRIEVKATLDDIVIPDAAMELLQAIVNQSRNQKKVYDEWGFRDKMNRGLGISAMFAGESGTGKTMAAEAIANELRLNLYRIDLSAVVSKYIGDTEKNLCRLFDAAEDGGTILFFDEADSLFGKRSEVKDSHDRFANIGVNYLLQRMESFSGLAILATNMKRALDAAFMRRLRFIVDFPFPSAAQRETIWAKSFPKKTGSDLDFKWLARINLTGGGIHSVALNSAFASAAKGLDLATMPIVLKAAKAEMVKLDRHINESDFQWTEPVEAVA